MSLFLKKGEKLLSIEEKPFKLERELQRLTEENLETLFGLEFVSTEFERNGLRIDSLAFDPTSSSFVIIEYKRDQNFSVVDQGLSYLGLMLDHKAEFVLEYNERKQKALKRNDVDWSQSRVLFLMRFFSTFQQKATNFKDLPIELWEVTRFDNDSVLYERIQTGNSTTSIKSITKSKEVERVAKEVKTFKEEDVLPSDHRKDIYEVIKENLCATEPELYVHPTKVYLAFRLKGNWRNLIVVWFRSNKVRFEIMRSEPKDFSDPEKKVGYIKDSYKYFHQHISFIEITSQNKKEIEYVIYILRQALSKLKN